MNRKIHTYVRNSCLIILALLAFVRTYGQESSDELFQQSRTEAFEHKNYPKAIALSKQALQKSPEYTDIEVFLGRLYTWSDKPDSARVIFEKVMQRQPGNEDASLAYASLEYWNHNSEKALPIVNSGLNHNPSSNDLLILKIKILKDLNRNKEAYETLSAVLKTSPGNTEARALGEQIKDIHSKNKIGFSYDYVYFDKQFDDPWHLVSIDYGRQARFGPVIARYNYSNRFASSGSQFEAEAYPRISRVFYSYLGAAYSGDTGIFPKYRTGFSLYANLPHAYEIEGGFRLLHFSENTSVYTFSAGKYINNYWLNFRTYLTPSAGAVSQSYTLNIRYYYGSSDDYLSLSAGTGISPDESVNNILLNYKLKSTRLALGYRHIFNEKNVISLNGSWVDQEYLKDTHGNQINAGISYQKRF